MSGKLDSHGKLAILEIIVYVPAILFCIFNNFRYGFRREAGWIYLSIFCVIKLAGAGMIIDIQLNSKENLVTTATILNTVALSPLLSATLSFVNGSENLKNRSSSMKHQPTGGSFLPKLLKPVHILIIIGLGLSITGAIDRTHTVQKDLNTGASLLKIATIVFLGVWAILCLASLSFWAVKSRLSVMQRVLLPAVMMALPFLLVRIIYSGLNALNLDTSTSTGHTGKFNPVTGSWALYLVLGMGMELIVVALYSIAGVVNHFKARKLEKSGSYSGFDTADPTNMPQPPYPSRPGMAAFP